MKKLVFTLSFLIFGFVSLSAQHLEKTWGFHGAVSIIKPTEDYIYVGGDMDYYGPQTGSVALLKTNDVTPDLKFPLVEGGKVIACASDGKGGWYIGGTFTKVGGVERLHIAQISADGYVTNWNPTADGEVTKIVVYGNYVYVAGYFSRIGGLERHYLAKLKKTDGSAVDNWNPKPDEMVFAIAPAGNYIYVGGRFLHIGGTTRQFLAKLKVSDGSLVTDWYPIPDHTVRAVVVHGGNVYVGGDFTSFWGIGAWYYAARLDTVNGGVGGHFWHPTPNHRVTDITIVNGNIFLAGEFTQLGIDTTVDRQFLASVEGYEGKPDLFFEPNPDNFLHGIKAYNGKLYVYGQFTHIGGLPIQRVARINVDYGLSIDQSWEPNPTSTVRDIAFNGNNVLIGGNFSSAGGKIIGNLVRLNKSDFTLDKSWGISLDGSVSTIAVDKDNVYIGGYFNYINGSYYPYIAKLSKTDGLPVADWMPFPDKVVTKIISRGDTLIVGGGFNNICGVQRDKIAMIKKDSPVAFDWHTSVSQGLEYGRIMDMDVKGNYVYAAGRFYNSSRTDIIYYFKRISLSTGGEDPNWDPAPDREVSTIFIHKNDIFVGGSFMMIGQQPVKHLAKLDVNSGMAYPNWNPMPDMAVSSITADNEYVYIAGEFQKLSTTPIKYVARLSYKYGQPDLNWTPNPNFTGTLGTDVYAVAIRKEKIFIGGIFNYVDSNLVSNFAVYTDDSYFNRIPPPPSKISTVSYDHSILLLWRKVFVEDLIKYNIYESTDTTKGYTFLTSVPATDTTYFVTGLKNGLKYYFKITAEDNDGNESEGSSTVAAVPNLVGGGLMAYYPFTNGESADSSGNDNNGVSYNVSPITDRFGNENSAFYFDGHSYLNCGKDKSLNPDTAMSVAFWINVKSNQVGNDSYPIIAKWDVNSGYFIELKNKKIKVVVNQNFQDSLRIPFNQWVFVAITFDSTTRRTKYYINGQLSQVKPFFPQHIAPSDSDLTIGYSEFAKSGKKFKGKLDDIRLYNRALTQAEIKKIFNYGNWQKIVPPTPQGLHCVGRDAKAIYLKWVPPANGSIVKYNFYANTAGSNLRYFGSLKAPDSLYGARIIKGTEQLLYYFQITSVDSFGRESNFSDSIAVYPPIYDAPEQLSPAENSSFYDTTSTIMFSWRKLYLVQNYRIKVGGDRDFYNLFADTLVSGDSDQVRLSLPKPLHPFYWKIRAENNCSEGPWSPTIFVDVVTKVEDNKVIPKKYFLEQNYPNPFGSGATNGNSFTTIRFGVPNKRQNTSAHVTLTVYNLLGQKVATLVDDEKSPGIYSVRFNALKLSSGIYFYRMKSGNYNNIKKMLIIK